MIRRGLNRAARQEVASDAAGFDAFELRLGDLMRGERATMGKSLLDVQRELKIKAAYIAAIENADPSAFDTPGFIAGYVRSYARYLGMDPEWAFNTFCGESGFATAHGMSEAASGAKPAKPKVEKTAEKNIFTTPSTPFVPARESLLSRFEPRAIGSMIVLIGLIGGLGFGGWRVLEEVQKVQLAPVENTPSVVADIDPLAGSGASLDGLDTDIDVVAGFDAPTPEALDRLYRPQALDAPIMVPRDGPIAALDPRSTGIFAPTSDERPGLLADAGDLAGGVVSGAPDSSVQVTETPRPGVQLVAVRPAWVRVRAADGSVIYEAIMNAGDVFDVPQTEEPATLRIGESGAVYFAVNGDHFGPVGPRGAVSSNVVLSPETVTETYAAADPAADRDFCGLAKTGAVQVAGISADFICP